MSIITASAFLAFSIALPFGPVSLMCVQRSLSSGALRGLACGAGASTAHGLFAALAVLGADAAAGSLIGWQPIVHLASSAALIAIGLRMVMKAAKTPNPESGKAGGLTDYLTGLMMALTNPATILPYLALAGSGLFIDRENLFNLTATVTGVLLGSVAWYATLSGSAWVLKDRLPGAFLSKLNLLAGPALIGMGLHLAIAG